MADKRDSDSERWLSGWEKKSIDEWEVERNLEDRLREEKEQSTAQDLWQSFQNAASSIARLYKEGNHPNCRSLWVPFQNSASSATQLYKDSQDAVRRSYSFGSQHGYRGRTKEVLAWAKKHRCNIRREELIAFLLGKPNVPVRTQRHSHRTSNGAKASPGRLVIDRSNSRLSIPLEEDAALVADSHQEPDLQPFRDALALQGLNGAMSNISMGHRGRSSSNSPAEDAASAVGQSGQATHEDFHCLILDEMSRRLGSTRKRSSADPSRVDSPNRKRMRLWQNDDDPIY